MSQAPLENSSISPYLIVGLGNPGREYLNNRHNAGFMLVQLCAQELGEKFGRMENHALIIKTNWEGKPVILAKPQTYMNESGKSVGALVRFYKIPLSQLLVAYDDIDLPLGAIRLRSSGGTGGHKGMQSIINVLGTNAFARLRLGIGRPPGQKQAADYVLKDFAPHEQEPLTFMLNRGVAAVRTFLLYGIEAAMNEFNTTANQAE